MPEPTEVTTQTPEDSPGPSPQGDGGQKGDRIVTQKKTDVAKFIEDSPVVERPTQKPKVEGKDEPSKQPPGEKKVLVSPTQKKEEEPEPKTTETEPEKKTTETEKPKTGKIKIGDVELSEEEWVKDHKDAINRSAAWKALTQRSQVAAAMSDEELKETLSYVHGSKKLPDNIHEHLSKVGELPQSFKYENEDGVEVEVSLKDIPKDFLDKLKNAVFVTSYKDLIEKALSSETLQNQLNEKQTEIDAANIQHGVNESISFMQKNPDFAVTLYEGDDLQEVMANIKAVGKEHPEYENFTRFMALGQYVNENGGTLEEAKQILYGQKKREEEISESITQNQETPTHLKTGKQPSPSDTDKFLGKFTDSKSTKMKSLGR